ncbi:MAG: DsbA family protein [Terriglobia bacterium]
MGRISAKFSVALAILALGCAVSIVAAAAAAAQASSPAADQATRDKIVKYLRERFPIAPSATIAVGPFRPSIYPGFELTTITIVDGKNKQSQDFYLSKAGDFLIQGNIYGLNGDPQAQVQKLIHTTGEPSIGPANAPVTIVEYADLECPMCAEMQQFIEKQLVPKYGNKIQVVFKEYPLFNVHPWAVAAAVANECAWQLNAPDFVPYRSLIFQHQNDVKAQTAPQQLEDLGAQAGLDRQKLTTCIDSKASLPLVQRDFLEGQKLGVGSTPTFFINGKMYAGGLPPDKFFAAVDQALAEAAKK